ncbi:hypothetical protein ACF06Q_09200 [Streptomyces leeuwenhoekii]|uniref:hypothetical protein n=1 Tax=Streptomyces leeuwenhoekii TaxID=1437453 RepID=UPI0036F669BD
MTAPHRNAEPQTNGGTRAAMNPTRSRPIRSHALAKVTAPHATQIDAQHRMSAQRVSASRPAGCGSEVRM